ncbi:hypothetical protein BFW38_14410 [Terasakiispira papahanaumokuakeensis]|uniref:Type II secretion system protein H n=1 Tax=Terasakiispira papahanaumokuakeensis TaxID=197479 RepID=A0A1E2VC66_9GAMM|nr:GspH/FimT family pseudopilin [Terasakiispira papahanaumokuakeensis]ODC04543.1 hypothetical protein BFW38_14410 [Terasakiispira papahanaumokuakeensis]
MRGQTRRFQAGWTLLELWVALFIVGVLLSVAMPGWQQVSARWRQSASLPAVEAMLQQARQQALLRNLRLSLCPVVSPGDQQCAPRNQGVDQWLLLDERDQVLARFGQGHYPVRMTRSRIQMPPPWGQNLGASVLVCTGFSARPPIALVVSANGRVRRAANPSNLSCGE